MRGAGFLFSFLVLPFALCAAIPPAPQFPVGAEPIGGLDGVWEMTAKFSDLKLYRGCWERDLVFDMSKAKAIAFDFWCDDEGKFENFIFYVRSGSARDDDGRWSSCGFRDIGSGKWKRIVLPVAKFKALGGGGADFSRISGVRIAGYRNSTEDAYCAMANLSFVDVLEKEESEAERQERRQRDLARISLMPGKDGERRLAWCHSAWGLGRGHDWDSSIKFLKDCKFTDIVANLAWGAGAFYKSDVLEMSQECAEKGDALEQCLAACRKYGIKCHVWMVCWNMGRASSSEAKAQYKRKGRTQKERNGQLWDGWLCPSHPENIQLTVDAMCELAGKGVDGIHYDYIRYPGSNHCCCDGCRRRFEEKYGKVENWPKALRSNDELRLKWEAFRRSNIDRVVMTVSQRIRPLYPNLEISAAVFPNEISASVSVAQNWSKWCDEGWVDTVCPMTYTQSPEKFRSYIRSCRKAAGKARLYPGIGVSATACPNVGTDEITFADEVMVVREEGCEGFTLFNFDRRGERAMRASLNGPLR